MTIETIEEAKTILYTKTAPRKASDPQKPKSEPKSRKPRGKNRSA